MSNADSLLFMIIYLGLALFLGFIIYMGMEDLSMTEKNIGKGNLLFTYLFEDNEDIVSNLEKENTMIKELQELAEQWKKRGLIRRYTIADDELINEKLRH